VSSDQKRGAREPWRSRLYLISIGCLVAAGLIALACVSGVRWSIPGVSPDQRDYIAGFVAGLLLAGAITSFLKARVIKAADPSMPIDAVHGVQRRMLTSAAFIVAAFGGLAIIGPLRHAHGVEIDFAVEFAFVAIAGAAAVTFGVGFVHRRYRLASNDEFVKAVRLRSVQIGYMLAVAGAAAAYLVGLFRPDLAAVGMPAALLAAVLIPCAYFLMAERRASGDE